MPAKAKVQAQPKARAGAIPSGESSKANYNWKVLQSGASEEKVLEKYKWLVQYGEEWLQTSREHDAAYAKHVQRLEQAQEKYPFLKEQAAPLAGAQRSKRSLDQSKRHEERKTKKRKTDQELAKLLDEMVLAMATGPVDTVLTFEECFAMVGMASQKMLQFWKKRATMQQF